MLHAFTCKTIQENFPSIHSFYVRPMRKMAEILFRSLPKKALTINGINGEKYQGDFMFECVFVIPITVFSKF
jgi:hypothetical protein